MIYWENTVFLIPLLLIALYGFAPLYILQYFKKPFDFLRYYIIVAQIVIVYFHLTSRDYYNDKLTPLYQVLIINPTEYWYIILYLLLNLILIAFYIHPIGKQKKVANYSGYIAIVTMLLSWGVLFGWMGSEDINYMNSFIPFTIRLMGPMFVLLPQTMWMYIFGKHTDHFTAIILSKLQDTHNLADLIPAYNEAPREIFDALITDKHIVRYRSIELVYNQCLDWLDSIGAVIQVQNSPHQIQAVHGGLYENATIKDWPKIFDLSLKQIGEDVEIIIKIDTEGERFLFDSTENRRREWKTYPQELWLYLDADYVLSPEQIRFPEIDCISRLKKPKSEFSQIFALYLLFIPFFFAIARYTFLIILIPIGILGLYNQYREYQNLQNEMISLHPDAQKENILSENSKKILILLAILGVSIIYLSSEGYFQSNDYTTENAYGVKFDYPSRLYYEALDFYDTEPVSKESGIICCWNYKYRPREMVLIKWDNLFRSPSWENDYKENLLGQVPVELSEGIAEYYDHSVRYANFTIDYGSQVFNGVTSVWYCVESERVFYLQYYSVKRDPYNTWKEIIESFECH